MLSKFDEKFIQLMLSNSRKTEILSKEKNANVKSKKQIITCTK